MKRDFRSAYKENNGPSDFAIEAFGLDLPTGPEVIEEIDIFDIHPDPQQPRKTLPSNLSHAEIDLLFDTWLDLIDRDLSWLQEMINSDPQDKWGPVLSSAEHSLRIIASLAGSIRQDGLNNPVTLTKWGTQFFIETGERRWLAYHLLFKLFGDSWKKIKARIVEEASVWRQAAENNQREDLTIIARTRQFAILLMDLHRREGAEFQPFDAFPHERQFYAQVADEKQWRIPTGKRSLILNAMGLKAARQLSTYRDLLVLPDALWTQADDNALTEKQIVQSLHNWDKPTPPPQPVAQQLKRILASDQKKIQALLSGAGGSEDLSQIEIELEAYIRWLQSLRRQ